MIAYSLKSLLELEVLEEAKGWQKKNIISKEQLERIKEKHNHGLFIPNLFVRIGLFVLTIILVNAALGLFSIFNIFFNSTETVIGGFLLFFGLVTLAGLEAIISAKRTYRAGIDDGLLYMTCFYIIVGTCLLFNDLIERSNHEELFFAIIALPFLVAASIRYLDNFVTTISFGCFIFIVFDLFIIAGKTASAFIPFIIIALSTYIYFNSKKYSKQENLHHWRWNFKTIQFLSLLTLYLGGNYYVVRELSIEMLGLSLKEGETIPFAFIFHVTTIIIPLVLIFYGGKLKDRILFVTGLLTAILSILTIKYYYSIAPISISLTAGGLLLTGVIWYLIKYFSPGKLGITSEKEFELLPTDAEALIISYSFPQKQFSSENTNGFGGGEFGGAGAGGNF